MKVGILGGTFDPIHVGHLIIAESVRKEVGLDKILFIPSGDPPHKQGIGISSPVDRGEMVRLAIKDNEYFEMSSIEINREGYTYTIDTLKQLFTEKSGNDEYFFIVGADVLEELFTWKDYRDVFRMCEFLAVKRPGHDNWSFSAAIEAASRENAIITAIEAPLVDMSSSEIRKAFSSGKSIRYMVPKAVEEYIVYKNLYRTDIWSIGEIMTDMEKRLSPKRYRHSLGVMNESVRLAKLFSGDENKCRLAGLLHDIAKNVDNNKLQEIFDKHYLKGKCDGFCKKVLHGPVGRIMAQELYNINDIEVLEAIGCHVTGEPGMGITACIVFLADYTEPGREGKAFDDIREELRSGIYPAMVKACDCTLKYVLDCNEEMCVDMIKTRNYYLNNITLQKGEMI
ncbi:MAG: nicotinate-nucleotide adenylyltransferase [Clostridiales bacterium]|jgi:nicotinate-nucleotide adenylyltransferase|nr:nicotinate-nucleotide adenylyltransferase [Clostridiales bacterium]